MVCRFGFIQRRRISLTHQLTKKSKELDKCVEKATSLQKMIVSKGKEEGESLVKFEQNKQ